MSILTKQLPQPAQAILLAAGRGNRMRPLSDYTPKPLLQVQGKPLIQWHMQALAQQGFEHILINTAWLGEQIPAHFGAHWQHDNHHNSHIHYSREDIEFGGALETAGGIARALPHLEDVFWLCAGDAYAPEFVFKETLYTQFQTSQALAHIWLVPNPQHNPNGDFGLDANGLVFDPKTQPQNTAPHYTYSTIGLFKKTLFQTPFCDIATGNPQGLAAPLAPILRAAMQQCLVTGSIYTGQWVDVGTPERLARLNAS